MILGYWISSDCLQNTFTTNENCDIVNKGTYVLETNLFRVLKLYMHILDEKYMKVDL